MKKWLSIICLIGILAGVLSACGKDEPTVTAPDSNKTLLTAAQDLANELDRVPTIAELAGGLKTQVSIGASSASANCGSTEFSLLRAEPDNGDTYYPPEPPKEQVQDESVFMPMGESYSEIDNTIESLKLIKNQALEACKTFSTWISYYIEQYSPNYTYLPGQGVYRDYRMEYDDNRDLVVIEQRYVTGDNQNRYIRIDVSHTLDGKLRMNGISTDFTDAGIVDFTQLSYLEDSYYISVGNETPYNSHPLTVYNLQANDWALAQIRNDGLFDENGNPISEITPVLEETYHYASPHLKFMAYSDSGEFKFTDDSYGGQWWIGADPGFTLSLNLFEGWTSVTNTDGQQSTLVTGKGEFVFPSTGSDPMDPTGVCSYSVNYYDSRTAPTLYIRAKSSGLINDPTYWTPEETRKAIASVCESLGISFKDGYEEELYDGIFGYEQHKNAFHYFDGIYGKDLNDATFADLIERLLTEEASHATLMEMWNQSAMAFEEQTAEYEYFEFLDYTLTGTASVDETTHEISLAGIEATLAPSVLLKENTDYSLVFVWASADEHREVGSVDLHYTGESLTFESELSVTADRFPDEYGEYVLVAYLADDGGNRISTTQAVSAAAEFTAELSGESYKATLTVTKNSISVNNTVLPNKNSEHDSATTARRDVLS